MWREKCSNHSFEPLLLIFVHHTIWFSVIKFECICFCRKFIGIRYKTLWQWIFVNKKFLELIRFKLFTRKSEKMRYRHVRDRDNRPGRLDQMKIVDSTEFWSLPTFKNRNNCAFTSDGCQIWITFSIKINTLAKTAFFNTFERRKPDFSEKR